MSDLHITLEENVRLTCALELEYQGFTAAAAYLRSRIAALRPVWEAQAAEDKAAHTHIPPSDLLRYHRGSLPPQPATPHPQPTVVQPSIRPDQITSQP